MSGKCPSCKMPVVTLRGGGAKVTFSNQRVFRCVTYNCPACNAVLGCEMDPIALKSDTVAETAEAVLKALRKELK